MPDVELNGTTLHYVDTGSGTPFIVLHGGLGFDHYYMRKTFRAFEDRVRLIYLDQRGNGRSERPSLDTITIPQLAADVDALRAHLGLDEVGVIGHSYGGFVALQFATSYPDHCSHLIAMSTGPGVFEPTEDELAERADPSWITPEVQKAMGIFASGMPTTIEEFNAVFLDFTPIYFRNFDPAIPTDMKENTIFDIDTMGASMAYLMSGWSVEKDLGKIDCPTLVLCGRYDLMTTPECSKRMSNAIAGAELVWFENSGHFAEFEEPVAFEAAVASFLDRHA